MRWLMLSFLIFALLSSLVCGEMFLSRALIADVPHPASASQLAAEQHEVRVWFVFTVLSIAAAAITLVAVVRSRRIKPPRGFDVLPAEEKPAAR